MFIGSSKDGHTTAEAVQRYFKSRMAVKLWTRKGLFHLNTSYLESILHELGVVDFAVLVVTPDDAVTSRGATYLAARDYVVFEHGLSLGRLGRRRAFVLHEEGVKVISDNAGIVMATYKKPEDGDLFAAVRPACESIRLAIADELRRPEIGILPSTSLAVGYFDSFISNVVRELSARRHLTVSKKERAGPTGGSSELQYELSYDVFSLHIVVPYSISEITKHSLPIKVGDLPSSHVKAGERKYTFHLLNTCAPGHNAAISVIDIPDTLLASRKTIELTSGQFKSSAASQEVLERREIQNFRHTLQYLLDKEYGEECIVKIEPMDFLKQAGS